MKNWLVISALALIGACAAQVPGDDAPDFGDQRTSTQVSGVVQGLQSTTIADQPVLTPIDLDPSTDPVDLGLNKCTPEKQDACDMCVDGCDYLCSRNNGGGQAGGCLGLFCPTRCEVCVLSCYKACGKCKPSGF